MTVVGSPLFGALSKRIDDARVNSAEAWWVYKEEQLLTCNEELVRGTISECPNQLWTSGELGMLERLLAHDKSHQLQHSAVGSYNPCTVLFGYQIAGGD